jgi:hypothetical protein
LKKTLILCIYFTISLSAVSQVKYMQSETEVKAFSKKIADLFTSEDFSDAFSALKEYWPVSADEITDMRKKTEVTLSGIKSSFGDIVASAKTSDQRILDFAFRETYIIRYEYSAIRLKLTYFKNSNGWAVNSFRWDDSFAEEFK